MLLNWLQQFDCVAEKAAFIVDILIKVKQYNKY